MTATYHHIVCTAGISLFGGPNIYGKLARECKALHFERANPLPAEGLSPMQALAAWEDYLTRTGHVDISADPTSVSAEYSLLYALRQQKRLAANPRVVLIHTDTLGGRAAVLVIRKVIERDFAATVVCRCIEGLDVSDTAKLAAGFGSFMEIVAGALAEGEPSGTCFAPVGGYKVMTSMGYLAGAYMGYPSAYLHEDSQVLQTVPPVPIQLSTAVLREVGPALRATREPVPMESLSNEDRHQIRAHPYLFEHADDHVVRNAFGVFLSHRPALLGVLGPRIRVSPAVVSLCANDTRAKTFVCGQIQELEKKLANGGPWGELHHHLDFANLKNAAFCLYKGSSNGTLVGRAAYQYDKNTGDLWINRAWTSHDYTREAAQGVGFFDNIQDIHWIDWSETVHPARD